MRGPMEKKNLGDGEQEIKHKRKAKKIPRMMVKKKITKMYMTAMSII